MFVKVELKSEKRTIKIFFYYYFLDIRSCIVLGNRVRVKRLGACYEVYFICPVIPAVSYRFRFRFRFIFSTVKKYIPRKNGKDNK